MQLVINATLTGTYFHIYAIYELFANQRPVFMNDRLVMNYNIIDLLHGFPKHIDIKYDCVIDGGFAK